MLTSTILKKIALNFPALQAIVTERNNLRRDIEAVTQEKNHLHQKYNIAQKTIDEFKSFEKKYEIIFNTIMISTFEIPTTIKCVTALFDEYDSSLPCNFKYLFDILEDHESKINLGKVAEYYANNKNTHHHYLLDPLEYSKNYQKVQQLYATELGQGKYYSEHFSLALLDLNKIGINGKVYGTVGTVTIEAIGKQYEYQDVCFSEGDIVLDCGAYTGDMSIICAAKIGIEGKVYSFEAEKTNIKLFNMTLKENPQYADNIYLVEKFVSNENTDVHLVGSGPGSNIVNNRHDLSNAVKIQTIKIDDFVNEMKLEKVDFIKMDVEGSELKALYGAVNTIRKYCPKLAISVYHCPWEDIYKIPKFLNELGLGYKFYIRPNFIMQWEIILYAKI